ncbi:hypothetical protein FE257_002263 [Aspergillus nanangensis]|uniref:Uncharacterized protein n=1 Tax=Aspergillus nanangensis TaxID=2582783 RepID=A0AAD4GP59_ASPNN|nr:hypothetical protein FE257_002263 [Aspergillus nanangensis]
MDPPSFSLDKRGGNRTAVGQAQDLAHHLRDNTSLATSSLPSARDILQPLSHLTALPSSGYLAAVLGRERHARAIPTPAAQASLAENLPGGAHPMNRRSDTIERGGGTSDESRAEVEDPQWTAFTPTGWRGEEINNEEAFGVSGAGQIPPVIQQRSQTVQYLHDVDEEGSRSWRRVVVEYS